VRVWRAAPDEAPAVASLLAAFRDHLGYDQPSDASMLASVERLIGRDDAEYLLAGDDEPVAVVQVRYRWSVWWDAEDCWLEDLYVSEQARGRGVGRTLTQAVIDRASARGCRRVELDVNSENPAAMALYRSLGFDTGKTGGQDIFMRRRLSEPTGGESCPGTA
jgi:ribosomal protein S18 acetylase RimI-like enzyme